MSTPYGGNDPQGDPQQCGQQPYSDPAAGGQQSSGDPAPGYGQSSQPGQEQWAQQPYGHPGQDQWAQQWGQYPAGYPHQGQEQWAQQPYGQPPPGGTYPPQQPGGTYPPGGPQPQHPGGTYPPQPPPGGTYPPSGPQPQQPWAQPGQPWPQQPYGAPYGHPPGGQPGGFGQYPPGLEPEQQKKSKAPLWIGIGVLALLIAVVAVLGFIAPGFFFKEKVFDAAAVEQGVEKILTDEGVEFEQGSASCPTDQPVRQNHTFTCTVTIDGEQKDVPIKVVDAEASPPKYQVETP
ncbi:MAG: DUF4333 domain-containing protein [Actinophytocola sp.]|nr:DUF4333 domain-containing protein [Actinophytocola sp.]